MPAPGETIAFLDESNYLSFKCSNTFNPLLSEAVRLRECKRDKWIVEGRGIAVQLVAEYAFLNLFEIFKYSGGSDDECWQLQ